MMNKEPDWFERYGIFCWMGSLVVLVLAVGFVTYDNIKRPCLRTEQYACERSYCAYMDPWSLICQSWAIHHDICTHCLERKP